ncbi:MAG: topoisomerase DNA-binding C4 zinc finger domain-containing protein, partial [Rhodobacteraceae bacterium]|nr:topoisomerase DNA-binding C4 zinc finger domain-containing protein [Paracoccaceae bacterium]
KDKNRLIPEDKGRLVTIFLTSYFGKYLEYDFTADLEEQLDDISAGSRPYKEVLARFWRDFSAALAETADLRITEVLEKIDEVLAPHLYPPREDGSDPRTCPTCGKGRLNLKTARSGGAFIGCSNYPECRYTRPLSGDEGDSELSGEGKLLGHDRGDAISLRAGRFGVYVQRGEVTAEQPKPPRASLPKGWAPDAMDLEKAVSLLDLPRFVGPHPEDGAPVEAGIGRFGPYVKHNATYANLPEVDEVFTIGMNRAVEVLAAKLARGPGRGGAAAQPLAVLGEHPSGGPVQVMPGRYGPYVKWDKVNATLPKGMEPGTVTLEQALELIAAKAGAAPKGKKKAAARTADKKTAPKKATTRKKSAPEG